MGWVEAWRGNGLRAGMYRSTILSSMIELIQVRKRAYVVIGDMDETAGRIVLEELRRISGKDKWVLSAPESLSLSLT